MTRTRPMLPVDSANGSLSQPDFFAAVGPDVLDLQNVPGDSIPDWLPYADAVAPLAALHPVALWAGNPKEPTWAVALTAPGIGGAQGIDSIADFRPTIAEAVAAAVRIGTTYTQQRAAA